MKAVVATERRRASSRVLTVKKDSNNSIMKTASVDFRGEKFNVSDEMRECFLKLIEMVPGVPRNEDGNIDGTVLMQYVIDYILDLELQLDGHGTFSSQTMVPTSFQSKLVTEASSREPLTEKSIDNIVSPQIPSRHTSCSDECLSRTPECDIRPASK